MRPCLNQSRKKGSSLTEGRSLQRLCGVLLGSVPMRPVLQQLDVLKSAETSFRCSRTRQMSAAPSQPEFNSSMISLPLCWLWHILCSHSLRCWPSALPLAEYDTVVFPVGKEPLEDTCLVLEHICGWLSAWCLHTVPWYEGTTAHARYAYEVGRWWWRVTVLLIRARATKETPGTSRKW